MATSGRDNVNLPSGVMEGWCPITSDLITTSLVPKTKHMYELAWQIYNASFDSPVAEKHLLPKGVLKFLVMQREGGKSLHLVRRRLSAITFFAGLKGVTGTAKDPRWSGMVQFMCVGVDTPSFEERLNIWLTDLERAQR
ncbi:hypothetical protein NDU88_007011 [Pleurodeles waltl]|uniref:Uncharacterized protein n=1 Tax=Pleurodeles waltl TaxID=8319 RepID=A0AAV7PMQ6_PLEWA|nr:hypothetical protein NDU88_007011 [Pleurodeles waltl]